MIMRYLEALKGKIYKLLPIYEEDKPSFKIYAKSLLIELKGATLTFPFLNTEKHFIDIINIVNYFTEYDVSYYECKKQVFKCLDLAQHIWTEEV
jgi:hypothetical protein